MFLYIVCILIVIILLIYYMKKEKYTPINYEHEIPILKCPPGCYLKPGTRECVRVVVGGEKLCTVI